MRASPVKGIGFYLESDMKRAGGGHERCPVAPRGSAPSRAQGLITSDQALREKHRSD